MSEPSFGVGFDCGEDRLDRDTPTGHELAPGVKRGGFLNLIRRDVRVRAAASLPVLAALRAPADAAAAALLMRELQLGFAAGVTWGEQ